jgi:hypothetical protein
VLSTFAIAAPTIIAALNTVCHSAVVEDFSSSELTFGDGPDQERLRAVFAYWMLKRNCREMPSRADIEPADLKPYLPQLVLLDVEGEPPRFRYRLVGTEVSRIRGGLNNRNPTALYVDEVTHHQGTSAVLAHYRRVVEERRPSLDAGTYTPSAERPWLRFTRLVMPLSADGARVDMLLVMLVPVQ